MIITDRQLGFTAVELLITLFIASIFLIAGYQLYGLVIKDSGEARMQSRAVNVAEDYLQRYKTKAINPCSGSISGLPTSDTTTPISGLSNTSITVAITCPFGTTSPASKVQVSLSYGNPQKTIIESTYVTP